MKERVIKDLKEKGIIKYGTFTLKSGKKSDYYINLRECVSHPKLFSSLVKLMSEKAKKVKPDTLLGVSYTGIPLAAGISLNTRIPFCYNVKEIKSYGIPSKIIGNLDGNVLVIDDLITDGSSKLELINGLEKIIGVLVFVDREEGGKENLEKKGLKLYSILRKKELFDETN
jgi:orotate phosphoribosyltransferase